MIPRNILESLCKEDLIKIRNILQLEDGWNLGNGKKIDYRIFSTLSEALYLGLPIPIEGFSIYPTNTGCLSLEWEIGDCGIVTEFKHNSISLCVYRVEFINKHTYKSGPTVCNEYENEFEMDKIKDMIEILRGYYE